MGYFSQWQYLPPIPTQEHAANFTVGYDPSGVISSISQNGDEFVVDVTGAAGTAYLYRELTEQEAAAASTLDFYFASKIFLQWNYAGWINGDTYTIFMADDADPSTPGMQMAGGGIQRATVGTQIRPVAASDTGTSAGSAVNAHYTKTLIAMASGYNHNYSYTALAFTELDVYQSARTWGSTNRELAPTHLLIGVTCLAGAARQLSGSIRTSFAEVGY